MPSFIANFYRCTTGAVEISNWYLLFGIRNTTLSLPVVLMYHFVQAFLVCLRERTV